MKHDMMVKEKNDHNSQPCGIWGCAGNRKLSGKIIYEEINEFTLEYNYDSCRTCYDFLREADWPADTDSVGSGNCHGHGFQNGYFRTEYPCSKGAGQHNKALTALVVIENANLDDMVTFFR